MYRIRAALAIAVTFFSLPSHAAILTLNAYSKAPGVVDDFTVDFDDRGNRLLDLSEVVDTSGFRFSQSGIVRDVLVAVPEIQGVSRRGGNSAPVTNGWRFENASGTGFSAFTPSSFNYRVVGGNRLSRTSAANVFTAWRDLIEFGGNNSTSTLQELDDCASDVNCDFDAVANRNRETLSEWSDLAETATIETAKEVQFDAVPVPTTKFEAIVEVVVRGVSFLSKLFGDSEEPTVESSQMSASVAGFSINPDFRYYEGLITLDLQDVITSDLVGKPWINSLESFSGFENVVGLYTPERVAGKRVTVSFRQLESTALPVSEPNALWLLAVSLALVAAMRRRLQADN